MKGRKLLIKSLPKHTVIAVVLSCVLLGGGRFVQKRFDRAVLTSLAGLLYLYFLVAFGFPWMANPNAFVTFPAFVIYAAPLMLFVYAFQIFRTYRDAARNESGEAPYSYSGLVIAAADFFKSISGFFARYSAQLKKHTFICIISVFVLGAGQIRTKQLIKGFIFLALQALYIFFMIIRGASDISALITLNSPDQPTTFTIVYGVLSIFITLLFAVVYKWNLSNVVSNLEKREKGLIPDGFKTELKSLFRGGFYKTLLAVPVVGVLAFTVLPLVFMISIAFTGYGSANTTFGWEGLQSFKNLVLLEGQFKTLVSVTGWTLIWAILATFTNYFFGILLAILINKKSVKMKVVFRTIFIITMATPQFVSLLVMNQLFGDSGPVNLVISKLFSTKINFWGNVTWARSLIIIINMWVGIPYLMMLTSGILQNIPSDLYESARIEGAGKWKQFSKITMPYMFFMTTPLIITQFVGNINNFNVIYLLTQGKPFGTGLENAGGTDILITWLYKLTKTYRQYNLSAAIGIIIFFISATISLVVYRRTSSYKKEGDFS